MSEYVEKHSPMEFKKVSPPMMLPKVGSPMDELTPPMGIGRNSPSDGTCKDNASDEDEPSDGISLENNPPMVNKGKPSDENVREAITSLLELTACVCEHEYAGDGFHDPYCYAVYRADVVVLVAAAEWTAPGARVRERYR